MKKFLFTTAILTSLVCMQAQNTVMNGDFEIWSYGKPVNWTVGLHGTITSIFDIPVEVNFGTQSNDANSGSYAVRVTSNDFTIPYLGYSFNLPGILQAGESEGFSIPLEDILSIIQAFQDTTGAGGFDPSTISSLTSLVKMLSPGVPCTIIPHGVTAWVKYQPQENDRMVMLAVAKQGGMPVDYAYELFEGEDETYRQIGVSFENAGESCDSIMVVILSAIGLNSGAVLYVDDVKLLYSGTGITVEGAPIGEVYPNPASDRLHLRMGDDGVCRWVLTDMAGRTMLSGEAVGETDVDIRDCAPGVYLLQVDANGKTGVTKVVIR